MGTGIFLASDFSQTWKTLFSQTFEVPENKVPLLRDHNSPQASHSSQRKIDAVDITVSMSFVAASMNLSFDFQCCGELEW